MTPSEPNDAILTGLPRSGTTLACELLNLAPNTVALDEPIDDATWVTPRGWRGRRKRRAQPLDSDRFLAEVDSFFKTTRASLLAGEGATSRNVDGKVLGRKFAEKDRSGAGLRQQLTTLDVISVEKPLAPDFVLAVKHNAGFTVALEHLVKRYRTFAIVRNPLAILSSWQTVSAPVNRGRLERAERVDPELHERLDATEQVLDRQFVILEWFFGRFERYLAPERVLKYEEMVESGGSTLGAVTTNAARLAEPLGSRNRTDVYGPQMMRELGERLLQTDGPWWHFYGPDSVRQLIGS